MTRSLTGLGYDFAWAVADIVDNSLTFRAKNVWIDIRSDTEDSLGLGPYVLITDDGSGMDKEGLVNGMRYGSESSEDDDSLGKFGLGMKTASTSQAETLAVATRASSRGLFHVRVWDLEYLRSRSGGQWVLLEGRIEEFPPTVKERLRGKSGTAVLWTHLVRALPNLGRLSAAGLDKRMNDLATETRGHLALVFNRFITGDTTRRRRKIRVWVNDREVEPRDPLLAAHPKTKVQRRKSFVVKDEDIEARIFMTPAILPNKSEFVTPSGEFDKKAYRIAAEPKGWNASQGFYVYRLDRLIQHGGWSNLRANDEHTKTARIAVDLDRDADELFHLNVSKTRVLFPDMLKDDVRSYTAKIVSQARESYGAGHGSGTRKSRPKRTKASPPSSTVPKGGTKAVLTDLYATCKNARERKIFLEIVQRVYQGFDPS